MTLEREEMHACTIEGRKNRPPENGMEADDQSQSFGLLQVFVKQ